MVRETCIYVRHMQNSTIDPQHELIWLMNNLIITIWFYMWTNKINTMISLDYIEQKCCSKVWKTEIEENHYTLGDIGY